MNKTQTAVKSYVRTTVFKILLMKHMDNPISKYLSQRKLCVINNKCTPANIVSHNKLDLKWNFFSQKIFESKKKKKKKKN